MKFGEVRKDTMQLGTQDPVPGSRVSTCWCQIQWNMLVEEVTLAGRTPYYRIYSNYRAKCICSATKPLEELYKVRNINDGPDGSMNMHSQIIVREVCKPCKSLSCPCEGDSGAVTLEDVHNNSAQRGNKDWGKYTTDDLATAQAEMMNGLQDLFCACELPSA
jgi:hypothetical protein